jgi:hypothetical protein
VVCILLFFLLQIISKFVLFSHCHSTLCLRYQCKSTSSDIYGSCFVSNFHGDIKIISVVYDFEVVGCVGTFERISVISFLRVEYYRTNIKQ